MVKKAKNNDQDHIKIYTTGSNIRFEPAHSTRQSKSSTPKLVVNVAQEISPVNNFLDFLKEHAVVGLIIGFVIGGQVQVLVKAIVASFLDPLTKLAFGTALSQRTFTLHFEDRSANFGWGSLVYNLVIFIFVLITLYVVIKLLKLDTFEKNNKGSK